LNPLLPPSKDGRIINDLPRNIKVVDNNNHKKTFTIYKQALKKAVKNRLF